MLSSLGLEGLCVCVLSSLRLEGPCVCVLLSLGLVGPSVGVFSRCSKQDEDGAFDDAQLGSKLRQGLHVRWSCDLLDSTVV